MPILSSNVKEPVHVSGNVLLYLMNRTELEARAKHYGIHNRYHSRFFDCLAHKILILGKVGFQSDQTTAASWSGNTCQSSNQLIFTLIRLLFVA